MDISLFFAHLCSHYIFVIMLIYVDIMVQTTLFVMNEFATTKLKKVYDFDSTHISSTWSFCGEDFDNSEFVIILFYILY